MSRHYWGYRIDANQVNYFRTQLENGLLRQGWGWDNRQDLRDLKFDGGAKRNLPIFNKVKKGDILLIPRLPTWNEVAVVEATDDFSNGYRFDINPDYGDYGHIFPAKLIKQFVRSNENISGSIRATIKNISRFWNIDFCRDEIEDLLQIDNIELRDAQSYTNRFANAINDSFTASFDHKKFSTTIYDKMSLKFSNEEWEYALVEGLKNIFPEPFIVERTGGISEKNHGTDILITIPGILNFEYGIAIQVKDYDGYLNENPLEQLSKADYRNNANFKIIDKILIVTKANKEANIDISDNQRGIRVIFAAELQELLAKIGLSYIGLNNQ